MGMRVAEEKTKPKATEPGAKRPARFASLEAPKAAPTKPPPKTVGKRFTKKVVVGPGFAHPVLDGAPTPKWAQSRLVQLDPEDYFDPKRTKASALQTLFEAGYPQSALYGEGGYCHALEKVRFDGHEDDSTVGLAAQALWHCRQLELLAEVVPQVQWKAAAAHAYAIGRLDAFRKAYGIEDRRGDTMREQAAAKRRLYSQADRDSWIELDGSEFSAHTVRRSADLIASRLSLPTEAVESIRKVLPKRQAKKTARTR
jgi:hypothetical protein